MPHASTTSRSAPPSIAPTRLWAPRLVSLGSVIYGVIYVVWLVLSTAPAAEHTLIANIGKVTLIGVLAGVAMMLTQLPTPSRREQWAWRLIALWALLTFAGDALSAMVEQVWGGNPSQSWANLVYLASYPALLAGLLLLPRALRSRRDGARFALDAATVVVAGGMLLWHFVIAPTAIAGHGSLLQTAVSIAYPVGDLLVLLGVTTILLRCPRGARRRPLLLLAASVVAMLVADIVWANLALSGDYGAGGLQDVGYMTQYVLFALSLAAERQRRRLPAPSPDDRDTPARLFRALPYVSVAGGYTLLVVVARDGDARLLHLVIGAMLLTVLVVLRQVITLRENLALQRERALRAGEARFRSLVQHAADVIAILEPDSTLSFVSPASTRTIGYAPSELTGTSFFDLVHPDDVEDARTRINELAARHDRELTARWRLRRRDGAWITADTTGTNLLSDANVRGLLLTTRDVTERCRLEAQLEHQAFHDPLTGLANRALFLNRVSHELSRRPGERPPVAVLYVDLDHFKTVNDSLGHAAGDTLLVYAAERLSGCLRTFDTAARLGADEFGVLIEDVSALEDVTSIADRVTRAFADPFHVDAREIMVSASVGIARASVDQAAEDLIRNADLAMYLAKSRGRGQTALFEPAMHTVAVTRLDLLSDLRHAIERHELMVVYQPIHSLETQALVGVEALARWRHPTRGLVPPLSFIPIAEESGLITPIGRWVLEQACRDAQGWRTRNPELATMTVAVNLSGRQIPEPSLLLDVQRALDEAGLPPEALVLELTESVLLEHTEQARAVMDCLKMLGVGLAIDDFGTGYSSLSYLQQLPLDILKIDRSFVERMETDAGGEGLARAVIGLAASLSLRTVAEGIEHPAQAERLYALGCTRGQGYFYSAALPADQLEAYAQKTTRLLAS